MMDTIEQIVCYDHVISSTIALTGASGAMCGAIGSTKNKSGTVNAINAVATMAGVGGSVLVGTHIIKEHLNGNKELNNLYGLMAVPVLAVGAVRLATSFMEDSSAGSNVTHGHHNSGEDLSDKIDMAIDIITKVKEVYLLTDTSGCTVEKIIAALDELADEVDDCDLIHDAIKEMKLKTNSELVAAKEAAREAAKEEAIVAIEDVVYELDDCKTKDIETLVTEAEKLIDEKAWSPAIEKLGKASVLAEKM